MTGKRKIYSAEFKQEAVRLATTSGKSIAAVERELGLNDGTLKVWVRRASLDGKEAFPGHGRLKPPDAEVRRLVRELEIVRQERDILKKAIVVFSRTEGRSTGS
jgi:transposase